MLKILIVEDELLESEGLKLLIKRYYHDYVQSIESTFNGLQGVELAKKEARDIIFIDIEMPAMDGLTAIKKIRDFDPNVTIIIVTAYSKFEYAQQAIRMNVDDYLCKPYSVDSIKQLMNSVIEKKMHIHQNLEEDKQLIHHLLNGNLEFSYFFIEDKFFDDLENINPRVPLQAYLSNRIIPQFKDTLPSDEYQNLLLQVAELYQSEVRSSLKYDTLTILSKIKRCLKPKAERYPQDCIIQQIKHFVLVHYSEELSLDLLSENVRVSKYHLSRTFKEKYTQNISKYIQFVRLEKARLLLHKDLSLTDIAKHTSFNDLAYFSNLYKQHFGITPAESRTHQPNRPL